MAQFGRRDSVSVEARIGVLYDAPLAELLDHPVGVEADLAVLDVEEVEVVTVLGHGLHPAVRDHLTASH